jgi:cell division septal protein FtsQ|tara:strand:- start:57 stop:728 length:672 start_codon:yes stop_codon:yes gene_type:complete
MQLKKSKKILIYFFLFLMIGTLNNKNLEINNFANLDEIIVKGLDNENNYQIIDNLNLLKINNLFFINKEQIKDKIIANNLVEKYSVFKKYPSTLKIEISKTKFLALTKINNDNFFLGSNGRLIEAINFKKDIPFIFGDFDNESFFELKKAIDETNFKYNRIKNLFFFKSGRWDIETKSGLLIRLPEKNIKKSLQLMIDFLAKENNEKINKIDLRQYNQIIIDG